MTLIFFLFGCAGVYWLVGGVAGFVWGLYHAILNLLFGVE